MFGSASSWAVVKPYAVSATTTSLPYRAARSIRFDRSDAADPCQYR